MSRTHLLALLTLSTGCGLTPFNVPADDTASDGEAAWNDASGDDGWSSDGNGDDGSSSGSGDPSSDEADTVTVSLQGNNYLLDLADARFVEPAGMGTLLLLADSTEVLFHVYADNGNTLGLALALTEADGRQAPCDEVERWNNVTWSTNPRFTMNNGVVGLSVGGDRIEFTDVYLSATVARDGRSWDDGVVSGIFDLRLLDPFLGPGEDACELLDQLGGACSACDDGQVACTDVYMEDVRASEYSGDFDMNAGNCR